MLLLKQVTILDATSKWHQKVADILIEDGKIAAIEKAITSKKAKVVAAEGLHASIGWLDIGAQIGEPGFEHREDLDSVTQAAASGGFTALAPFPNTNPAIHSKSEVYFLKNRAQLVDFFPIGALSRDCAGVDLAELYDMAAAGAVAFSDGQLSIGSAGLLKRGLQYLKGINGLLINHPNDTSLSKSGQLHEGKISTQLGMKGIPALAETLMLKRDLDLLAYADSRLHIHNISTAESVDLIRAAKSKGLRITASVSVFNLIYNHEQLTTFDSNYKVMPPLREKSDCQALLAGLQDGTIDAINSNHIPLEIEAKKLEFVYADFGTIGLSTVFPLLQTDLSDILSLEKIIHLLAVQSRKVLGLPITSLTVDEKANLTLFQPNQYWTFTENNIYSKSANTPLIGTTFRGKVLGIINGEFHNLS